MTRPLRGDRLSDGFAVRTSVKQRAFLEEMSYQMRLSMGECVRLLIDEAMTRAGAI